MPRTLSLSNPENPEKPDSARVRVRVRSRLQNDAQIVAIFWM